MVWVALLLLLLTGLLLFCRKVGIGGGCRAVLKETWPLICLSVLFAFCLHRSNAVPQLFPVSFCWFGLHTVRLVLTFAVFWYAVLVLSCLYRWVAWVVLPILLLPNIFLVGVQATYGVEAFTFLLAAQHTTWAECSVFFTPANVAAVLLLLCGTFLLSYALSHFFGARLKRCGGCRWVRVLCSCAALVIGFAYPLYAWVCYERFEPIEWQEKMARNHPVGALKGLMEWGDYQRMCEVPDPAQLPSEVLSAPLPDALVLYIGESFRADHSVMNGYGRNTMPGISAMENVINMPLVYAKATSTLPSIQSLLSVTEGDSISPRYQAFTHLLAKHGYENVLLVGANTQGQWYESPVIKALLGGTTPLYSKPADAAAYAQDVRRIAAEHPHTFLLVEDGAGHAPYDAEQTVFGSEQEIDRYDNSLLDIDARLTAIISELKERDALLIFISDHGESFGEGGRGYHGGPVTAEEQVHVCCFIWYSDLYARRRPERVAALKAHAAQRWRHDFIYHTVISLAGIRSAVQNPGLDISRPQQP